MHSIEAACRTRTNFKTHPQPSTTIVLQAGCNEWQFMRIPTNVPSQHFLVAFEPTARQHDIGGVEVVEETIFLAYLYAASGARFVGQDLGCFGPVVEFGVGVFTDFG